MAVIQLLLRLLASPTALQCVNCLMHSIPAFLSRFHCLMHCASLRTHAVATVDKADVASVTGLTSHCACLFASTSSATSKLVQTQAHVLNILPALLGAQRALALSLTAHCLPRDCHACQVVLWTNARYHMQQSVKEAVSQPPWPGFVLKENQLSHAGTLQSRCMCHPYGCIGNDYMVY